MDLGKGYLLSRVRVTHGLGLGLSMDWGLGYSWNRVWVIHGLGFGLGLSMD